MSACAPIGSAGIDGPHRERTAATRCLIDPASSPTHVAAMDDVRPFAFEPRQSFAAPDPEACQTMADVRTGVDEIDRLLVALIARRQGYMDAAARIKTDRATVRDEARIREVLAKVKAEAERGGLAWSIAEPVWRQMMEQCIAYEFEVWDALRRRAAAPPG